MDVISQHGTKRECNAVARHESVLPKPEACSS